MLTLPESGRFLAFEPCWTTAGQTRPEIDGRTVRFTLRSPQLNQSDLAISRHQNANVFEFEADPADLMTIDIDGMSLRLPVAELCARSRVLWDAEEAERFLASRFGVNVRELERPTIHHLYAHKAKLHRCIPEAGYAASFTFVDDEPLRGEVNYRVRVEQRNGQRAWSSPIWVRPAAAASKGAES